MNAIGRTRRTWLKVAAAVGLSMTVFSLLAFSVGAGEPAAQLDRREKSYRIELSVASALPQGNVPLDPSVDCGRVIRDHGGSGVLDPNSLEVVNLVTGKPVPFARTEDFAYGERGRLEWVVRDPAHTRFEIRFRDVAERPALRPQDYTPLIGVGDLLRYNAGQPRPFALPYPARLADLTGDGKPDLVGCWNYAYRPGWPWDGIVCYPRVGGPGRFEFGDLTRIRYGKQPESTDFQHFVNIYMWADFADFDGDSRVDIVWCPANNDRLYFYRNTGRRDAGGLPVFLETGSVPRGTRQFEACRAVDLDNDGAMDVTVGDLWLRNTRAGSFPPELAAAITLDVPGAQCWFDVDQDRRLDAVIREEVPGEGLSNYRLAWRRNVGGSPPKFAEATPLDDVNAHAQRPVYVAAADDGRQRGLLVTQYPNQTTAFYRQTGAGRFEPAGLAQSTSAVISLSDQAWPYLCDWDGDGDLDLLAGGGYGWLQIAINEGSTRRPAWSEPQYVLSEGKPIRLTRDEILGGQHEHDMGYPYPAYVDWDGDGLPDLVVPNETNRIFWYRNTGARNRPMFGSRQQILCDGFPDSPELRALSATRASDPHSNNGVYPYEQEQPFFWRTGAALADFTGDGLTDLITHDGHTRVATLFVQYRTQDGTLHLRRERVLRLADGRPVNDAIVSRRSHWTESFRAFDWDGDGVQDLVYSVAGSHNGTKDGGSIYLLRNAGTTTEPVFAAPTTMRCFGEPIRITSHGPHPWAGDLDGDGLPDLVTCVEWSVYPFYSHNALEMPQRPTIRKTDHEIHSGIPHGPGSGSVRPVAGR